jgi:uncharacterized tellurite resistance protein B-like protein
MRSPIAGSPTERVGVRPSVDLLGDHGIARQLESHASYLRAGVDLTRRVEQVVLDQRLSDGQVARLEKRVCHRAADEQGVDARQEVLDHLELVRHLRAAEDRGERMVRPLEHAAEMLEFGGHQQPSRGFLHVSDDPLRRRVRPVRRSERVVHVDVREIGELLREGGVVLFLPRMKTQILQQDDSMVAGLGDRVLRGLSDAVLGEDNRPAPQLSGACGHGLQRVLWIRLALRAAEMRTQDDRLRAVLERVPDRRQRGADPRVIRDFAVLHRHVEVDAHQHAPACHVEIRDRAFCHLPYKPFATINLRRSTQRFE